MHQLAEQIFAQTPSKILKLAGGDINDVYEIEIPDGVYVVKLNDAEKFPKMLALEAAGLRKLEASRSIKTPTVFKCGTTDGKQFLVLEKIFAQKADHQTWILFGHQLAKLHQTTTDTFGLDHDNYIGSLQQKNTPSKNWITFLIEQRLQPMLEMAVNQGDVNHVESKIFDPLFKKLNELLPAEKPALLHGDLWAGNYLVGPKQNPVLIDPAIYFGHREMDLAMMHLFGGFPPQLFDAYTDIFPLEKNWQSRIELNQLYPLLVHVNLFGRSYWEKVQRIVHRYV